MNVVLKHIALFNFSLLLIALAPKNTCAQTISGSEKTDPLKTKVSYDQRGQKNTLLSPVKDSAPGHLQSRLGVTVQVGGSSFAFNQQDQVLFPADAFRTDSYVAEGHKIHAASAIGISYEKILVHNQNTSWNMLRSISLGVNAYYNESTQNGSIYEYSLLDFNNATYSMYLRSFRILLDAEWTLYPFYSGIMPFIEAGIGGAKNSMRFQNIPRPNIGADGGYYNLADRTGVRFAYELGAGLKVPVRDNFMLSARYLFADTGDAKSGIADNQTGVLLAYPLRTNVQSHSVLFGLSYLFG